MIYGKNEELGFYKGISKNLDCAIDFILQNRFLSGVNGKNEILGDEVFFNLQNVKTKEENDCFFELHKDYIDIHIILEGEEIIGYSENTNLTPTTDYDKEKDFQLLKGEIENRFHIKDKRFVIFFPDEPHMTLIAPNNPTDIKKIVFKIKI